MQTVQSRLKSRKILGVGEGADGQLHRSKITQILGNDSLTNSQIGPSDYPTGLQALQYVSCLWFSIIGLVGLFSPRTFLADTLKELENFNSDSANKRHTDVLIHFMTHKMRMYGAAMLALGSLCVIVTFGNWHSRRAVRIALIVQGFFCACEILASAMSDAKVVNYAAYMPNIARTLIILVSAYFFKCTRSTNQTIAKRSASE